MITQSCIKDLRKNSIVTVGLLSDLFPDEILSDVEFALHEAEKREMALISGLISGLESGVEDLLVVEEGQWVSVTWVDMFDDYSINEDEVRILWNNGENTPLWMLRHPEEVSMYFNDFISRNGTKFSIGNMGCAPCTLQYKIQEIFSKRHYAVSRLRFLRTRGWHGVHNRVELAEYVFGQ